MNVNIQILIAFFVLNIVLTITRIGKPRGPITVGDAIIATMIYSGLIVALFIWGGVR